MFGRDFLIFYNFFQKKNFTENHLDKIIHIVLNAGYKYAIV